MKTSTCNLQWTFSSDDLIFPKVLPEENEFFLISNFYCENWKKVKIKWTFGWIPQGFVELSCSVDSHPVYWDTYNVLSYKHYTPETHDWVLLYLEKFFNLSPLQATKISNYFNDENVLEQLKEKYEDVLSIKRLFLTEKRKKEFLKKAENHFLFTELRYYLYQFDFSESDVLSIGRTFWRDAFNEIKDDPFNIMKSPGISFKKADKLFLETWWDKKSIKRICASLYEIIDTFCFTYRSTYLYESELRTLLQDSLHIIIDDTLFNTILNLRNVNSKDFDDTLNTTVYSTLVIFTDNTMLSRCIFLEEYFTWEKYSASWMSDVLSSKSKTYDFDESELTLPDNKIMNTQQKEAIKNVFLNKLSIITWYGWTWKSTIIQKIVEKCEKEDLSYCLLVPTGKAVDVLINITWKYDKCSTIHRKIGILGDWKEWQHTISENVIIIDESSMISLWLFYSLIHALPDFIQKENKRIIFVWDQNQLRPIGIWQPFNDLLKLSETHSQLITTSKLTEVYRQKQDSLILENSKKIAEYIYNKSSNTFSITKNSNDWEWLDISWMSSTEIEDRVFSDIKSNWWDNTKDVILTPQYKWTNGVNEINTRVQGYLQRNNPNMLKYGYHTFYINDRVMHTDTNWYRENEIWLVEVYPLHFYTPKLYKKIEKLESIYHDLLIDDVNDGSIIDRLIYNKRDNSFYIGQMKVWEYNEQDDTIVIYSSPKEIDNLSFDTNVYNGNWWTIVAIYDKNTWWVSEQWNIFNIPSVISKWVDPLCIVDFWDKLIMYTTKSIKGLRLFYASTVHKAQWSQFHTVYALCLPQHIYMLDRNWLYTMISRAQSKLYYYSTPQLTLEVQGKELQSKWRWIFMNLLNYLLTKKEV